MRTRPWMTALLALVLAGTALRPAVAEEGEPPAEGMPEGGEANPGGDQPGGDAPAEPAADRTKDFPNLNLSWTLPTAKADAPARWEWSSGGNPNLQKQEKGTVAGAGLVKDGGTVIEMELHVQPARPGAGIEGFIDNAENIDNLGQNFESPPTPQVERDVPVGNWKGGAMVVTGKSKAGKPLQIRIYIVILKGIVYEVHVNSHENAQRDHKAELLGALAGFQFKDTDEGVRGPVAAPTPSHTEPRGKGGTDEKLDRNGLKLKKPAIFAELERTDNVVFAAEARKPGAYAYVGVQRFRLPKSQTEPGVKPVEEYVDDVENNWRNQLQDPVTRPKSEKTNKQPATFKGAKGYEYNFKGTAHGTTYTERGWVVKDSNAVWIIRTQLGGKDAATIAPSLDALVKSFVLEK